MNTSSVPVTSPVQVAPETFLIPNLAAAGDAFLLVNSLLIRGEKPIVVDTGAPVHHDHWVEMVYDLVDPADIRWVFLSHEDGGHVGALDTVLEAAPQGTLVSNFFGTERRSLETPVPLDRCVWLEPGDTFDVGDRRLRVVLPPIFDGPATRGLLDERTGVLWAVDSFAAMTTGRPPPRGPPPRPLRRDLPVPQQPRFALARVARPEQVRAPRRRRAGAAAQRGHLRSRSRPLRPRHR